MNSETPRSTSSPSTSAPTASALRQALAHLYADASLLDTVVERLLHPESAEDFSEDRVAGVDLDLDRRARCGFPEVIFGEGKSAEMIIGILSAQKQAGQDSLVTRVQPDQAAAIQATFAHVIYNNTARTIRLHQAGRTGDSRGGPVYVLTAGSSDRPVAEEAVETLLWMKIDCELIQDVGVAGPHRLQRHVSRLQSAAAIVCVAGMEAALPSVVGGYVPCPVIGVPTSVGYGASFSGVTALLSMLTCCSSNVVCVNIDAGFKGGYFAGIIASRASIPPE